MKSSGNKKKKVESKDKQLIIKEFEYRVVDLGYNPNDPNPIQALLKYNDIEIWILKEKIKILDIDYVQTL